MEANKETQQAQVEKYIRIRELTKGSFGIVYLVRRQIKNDFVIIKTMILDGLSDNEKKDAYKEAYLLKNLHHQNIIRFIDVFRQTKPKSSLNIVMEYAEGGDLFTKIRNQTELLPEKAILDWFTQICLAIKHIHKKKILHRDLKSKNIFLTKNGLIKLGDFGISKCLNCTLDIAKTIVGTPYYLSPEIVKNEPYSFKTDIWSLGVILYEMACQKMPFDGQSLTQLTTKIVKGEYSPIPSIYSKELSNLINVMLNPNSAKRPSIEDVLKFDIVKKRINTYLSEIEMSYDAINDILNKNKVNTKNQGFVDIKVSVPSIQKEPKREKALSDITNSEKRGSESPVVVTKPNSLKSKVKISEVKPEKPEVIKKQNSEIKSNLEAEVKPVLSQNQKCLVDFVKARQYLFRNKIDLKRKFEIVQPTDPKKVEKISCKIDSYNKVSIDDKECKNLLSDEYDEDNKVQNELKATLKMFKEMSNINMNKDDEESDDSCSEGQIEDSKPETETEDTKEILEEPKYFKQIDEPSFIDTKQVQDIGCSTIYPQDMEKIKAYFQDKIGARLLNIVIEVISKNVS